VTGSERKSEIRTSEINELLDKVRALNYKQYLKRIKLTKLRAFQGQTVDLEFPVTALVGPNGGGKTTILGAAAVAYQDVKPRKFFAKSGKYDDSMQSWTIEYEIVDKNIAEKGTFARTSSFFRLRWNRDAPKRKTLVFGVSRTVPANERVELQRCISGNFSVPDERIDIIPGAVAEQVAHVLDKDISNFSRLKVDPKGKVTLYTGVAPEGTGYSEFHFGAGESSVIRMITEIEAADENALILIEEIENGLHPVATRRMVEYLISVAKRKKCQVLFTTHSNDALDPLPSQAIWASFNGDVVQGKLDIVSLRAITGQIDAQLGIFVEDEFAKLWLEFALRYYGQVGLDAITIHAMAGDATAVKVNQYHNVSPVRNFPSVCFIDGDSQQQESNEKAVYRLPGESPETYVYHKVLDRIEECAAKLAAGMQVPLEMQAEVVAVVRSTANTNRDPHVIFSQVGERLGLISERVVQGAFLAMWAQMYPEEVRAILDPIKNVLPTSN
jgi:energy-coupling factor transporter ATP-binding protein EcfA2